MVNLVVGLFALSFWLRLSTPLGGVPVAVSGVGTVLLGLGGWLGGELVFVHGMGVEAAADTKPPSRAAGRGIA